MPFSNVRVDVGPSTSYCMASTVEYMLSNPDFFPDVLVVRSRSCISMFDRNTPCAEQRDVLLDSVRDIVHRCYVQQVYRVGISKSNNGLVSKLFLHRGAAIYFAVRTDVDPEERERVFGSSDKRAKVVGYMDTIIQPVWGILPNFDDFGRILVGW